MTARGIAQKAGVPVLAGSDAALRTNEEARALAQRLGYPVIVKAAMGGGGRGMRVALTADKLDDALDQARREAGAAFGVADVFLEKFVRRARHIEVQLLGDRRGGLVHLFERDCSIQRRHQKVVEIAPAVNLDPALRRRILDAALASAGPSSSTTPPPSSSSWTPTPAISTSSRSIRAFRSNTPSRNRSRATTW